MGPVVATSNNSVLAWDRADRWVVSWPMALGGEIGEGEAQKPAMHKVAHGDGGITLPVGMTGRASRAKAAVGDKPVFAYMASLPQP